jgi:hypothetical protein
MPAECCIHTPTVVDAHVSVTVCSMYIHMCRFCVTDVENTCLYEIVPTMQLIQLPSGLL